MDIVTYKSDEESEIQSNILNDYSEPEVLTYPTIFDADVYSNAGQESGESLMLPDTSMDTYHDTQTLKNPDYISCDAFDAFDQTESSKKIKKPMSAWILFSVEYREKLHREQPHLNFKDLAQRLSERYKDLSAEERSYYDDLAKKDKLRYQQEMLSSVSRTPTTNIVSESMALILPLARVKKIMKMDPDVNNIQKNALLAVTKVTELFLQYMGTRAHHVALQRRAKSVKQSDVIQAIHSLDTLRFLRTDFPRSMAPSVAQPGKRAGPRVGPTAAISGQAQASASILNFFGTKRKATFEPEDMGTGLGLEKESGVGSDFEASMNDNDQGNENFTSDDNLALNETVYDDGEERSFEAEESVDAV